jgi:hypothetical protein
VDQALKHIILEACDNMYTSQLEGYPPTTCQSPGTQMHLKQIYAFINPTQLAEKYNKMTAPINFQDPIETLFN